MRASNWIPLTLAAVLGCRSPVRVEPVTESQVRDQLQRFALTENEMSAKTAWVLRLLEGEELFEEDPKRALAEMARVLGEERTSSGSYMLAELSYLAARRLNDPDCYLASAIFAFDYLLPGDGDVPDPWQREFRWACDLYNSAILHAFHGEGRTLELQPGSREIPGRTVEVVVDLSNFPFETEGIELLTADELSVVGLDFRVRDAGLGAPVIAVARQREEGTGLGVQDETRVPATVFLRVEGDPSDLDSSLSVRLELHSTYDLASVDVGGIQVPLEADLSSALAADLQASELWRFDITGFLHGNEGARQNGLILNRPFEAGRIPVVLVHGTASNPSAWAPLINALTADAELRGRYQFWLFLYTTGNPIAFSAATLRRQLRELVERVDPEGKDEALRRMVVIGHSQGGLLTKMMAQTSTAESLALEVVGTPLEEISLEKKDEELIRRLYDFEPLPFVERLVFVSTPHGGSFLAEKWYARLAAKMVSMPTEVIDTGERVITRVSKERLPGGVQPRISTSLDNMRPDSQAFQFMSGRPIDPRVEYHSIIPIGGADPNDPEELAEADDGVVAYESAHIEGALSEVLVPSKHSCQGHPRTIIEVRRILREHVGLPFGHLRPLSSRAAEEPSPEPAPAPAEES